MKKGIILLFFIVLAIPLVYAETYSKQDALNWLSNETKGDESVEEVSMGLVALNSNGFRVDTPLTVFLQKNLDSDCFPKGSCSVKETSFGLFALGKLNQNTNNIEVWLNGSLRDAYVGKWLVQITSGGQGVCTLKKGAKEISVNVNGNEELVLDGRKIGNWVDVERGLGNVDIAETVSVNCPTIGSNVIISLIRQKNANEFIISKEVQGSSASLKIDNACYGLNGCDSESSFYAAWALNSLNKEVNGISYLEDSASDNPLYNAVLAKLTNKERFYSTLANKQGINGDFGNNIFITSMAVDALKGNAAYQNNVTKALLWLQSRQVRDSADTNGSLDGSEFFTSSATYLALKEGTVTAPRFIVNGTTGSNGYCGDTIVDLQLGEECDSSIDTIKEGAQKDCGRSCDVLSCKCNKPQCINSNECNIPKEYCDVASSQCITNQTIKSCKSNVDCNADETCDIVKGGFCLPRTSIVPLGEEGCKKDSDCVGASQVCNAATGKCEEEEIETPKSECNNGLCEKDEDEVSCPADCKKKETLPLWIWIVIALISLILLAYIIYSRFVKAPPKTKKTFYEPTKTNTAETKSYYKPVERSKKDEALERELDKSINEAQSLLKKR
ncbi:hypothetical protein HYT57_01470 [Candidatus Woesearchaeota archaeon]|nr:hypothetical protein [Candidatus Woesearchaeota archaeon]